LSLPPGYLNRVFSDPVKDDNRYKDYLKMAPVIMERIFVQKLPENDVVQFKRLVEFVTELKQLAECAINKAWYVPSARSHLPQ
jgi:hypothetical protein